MAASGPRTDILPDPRAHLSGVTRAGWQCPACLTVYSPDVEACHCATEKSLSERIAPEPVVTFGRTCTCTPFGPGTVPCPVRQPWQMTQVTC